MIELAQRVIALCGSTSELAFKPLPQDDPKQRQPDIRLAIEKLGWTPSIGLDQGLLKTIEYFRVATR
jgi:UDP-glucuronate decarboxylase